MKLTGEERFFYWMWLGVFGLLTFGVIVLCAYSMFSKEQHF